MLTYQTPGVYYERVDASGPAINAIRTDIAGFVGISSRGPVDTPVPLQSWRQFQAYFGEFTNVGYLAYAVRAFFENGGQRCWVVRVTSETATRAERILVERHLATSPTPPPPKPIWRIASSGPGVWGNNLTIRLVETHQAQTMTVPEACTPDYLTVVSTAGFDRAVLTHLRQGGTETYRVIASVDASKQRLVYQPSLAGFDLGQPIWVESVEYTLLVWEAGRLIQTHQGLSLIAGHPRYGPDLLAPLRAGLSYLTRATVPARPEHVVIEELRAGVEPSDTDIKPLKVTQGPALRLEGGFDGLAQLRPYDFIGEEIDALDSDQVRRGKQRGLRLLEEVSEISILAVPDIHVQSVELIQAPAPEPCEPDKCLPAPPTPPAEPRGTQISEQPPVFGETAIYQVQAAMIEQCEKLRDRIALLDPPFRAASDDTLGPSAARAWRSRFDTKYAAFYYPWLLVVDPLRTLQGPTRMIPPSGHVAGKYAQADDELGVHKAPANSPLVWAQDVSAAVNENVHGLLNELGINVIRSFPGRGLRIFGARTVSSDPDWRYVNVRRLLMMIEKAVYLSTQWAVFEPNDAITRAKLHLSLTSFLSALWQQGALMGDAPEAAFFVRCDEDNNPPSERANGRLLAEVGVAPSKPFEFVVLRVGRTANEFEIAEERVEMRGV